MSGIELKKSAVTFDEAAHTYHRGDEELSGITRMIHSVLRLGNYDEMNDYARQVILPQAAHYGTCVHATIQFFEETGIESTEYDEEPFETVDYGTRMLPAVDTSKELAAYRKRRPKGAKVLASEFIVDHGRFATALDAVWEVKKQIVLVDFKTNNLKSYEGGKDALKEYLSWQLSCGAFMFERQTGLKVDALKGFWVRDDQAEIWDIERKDDGQVRCLLEDTEAQRIADTWLYKNYAMQRTKVVDVTSTTALAVPPEVIEAITQLLIAEEKAKQMKEVLAEQMRLNGIKKWECEQFTATMAADTVVETFDSKAFQADNPELYENYKKQTSRKGGLRIKRKNI